MTFRKIILFLLLFLVSFSVYSQKEEIFFKHLTADDGLSHNSVYSINEDSLGFIWIGTRSGLNRFDGSDFKIYGNDQGLNNTYINTIFKDSKGRIWIGTQEGGLSRYNYETDNFTSWSNKSSDTTSISQDNVLSITEDGAGSIWIGTHDGSLNCFDESKGTFKRIISKDNLADGISVDRINSMVFENDSLLWLGTFSGFFNYNTVKKNIEPVLSNGKFIDTWVTSLYNENKRILWIGTKSGLIRYDKINQSSEALSTINSQLSSDLITDLVPLPDGRLMIATDGGGLNILNTTTNEISVYKSDPNNQYSLSNNSVFKIFVDKYNALWIGNYIGGINYYSKFDWKFKAIRHELNNQESLSDNHVRTFYEDREGQVWIGTLGGLNLYNPITGKFTTYTSDKSDNKSLSSNSVLSVYEDPKGFLWIGTFGGGISIFNKRNKTFSKYRNPDDATNSLDKANIYCIVETNNDKLCIASLGGIYLIDLKTGKLKRFQSSNSNLSNNSVKALCKDRNGNIWVGSNRGLNRFNPETEKIEVFLHTINDKNSLSNNRILTIFESIDGRIWVGTEGGGVSIYNPSNGTFSAITINEGLPDNVINAIVQDDTGIFWFSTNKGLVRYDESLKKMRTYTIADGLQGNEFYQNAALKASNGKIFFGGPYGFNTFFPNKLVYNTYSPKITLTDLYISNKLVRITDVNSPIEKQLFLLKTITLPYQSNFEIHFSVLGFISKGKYLCSYRLKGSNEGWTDFRNISSANFANLQPGDYTFMVRATNNDGFSSESLASIGIKILPPLWKTWWAFIIYTFVLGFLLILFVRINSLKIKAKHELLAKIKEKEQLEELNSMKLRFFTDISHEFKTPLTLILGHLDNLKQISAEKREETLNNIEKNAKRLLMLINQLLEFRKAENGLMKLKATKGNILQLLNTIKESFNELAERKGISFELKVNGDIPEVWFDSEKIEKIIFNLLSNSFKATNEGGEIRIEVDTVSVGSKKSTNEFLSISVTDSGAGINSDELDLIFERFYHTQNKAGTNTISENSGIGLAYSKRLIELHHGEINVISEVGKGSTFTIHIPLGKDHLSNDEIKDDIDFKLKLDYRTITDEILDFELDCVELQSSDTKLPIMLIVDDNPEVCNVLASKFKSAYYIITAFNGEVGFRKASKYLPDIIISDVMMPVVDGFEFCNRLKNSVTTSHIPIILLTAKSGEESQISGYKSGADAYISKPYNPDLLEATAENLIQNRQILRKKFVQQSDFVPSEIIENKIDEEFILKVIDKIENEAFSENTDVLSLCRELAMSRSVLYRKIKMLTGNSIQEFVRVVKLRKAARLLLESSTQISDIAYSSGFTNTKHFSTAFKKLFGKTPSEYRVNR